MDEQGSFNIYSEDAEDRGSKGPDSGLFSSVERELWLRFEQSNSDPEKFYIRMDENISILRRMVRPIFDSEFGREAAGVCLLAYDGALTESLYGVDSAICVGIRKGLGDAMRTASVEILPNLIAVAEELGAYHGMLMRKLIQDKTVRWR